MGSAARKIADGVAAEGRGRMKERSSAPRCTGDQKLLSASMATHRQAVEVRKPRAARLKDGAGWKVSSAVICILPGGFAGLSTGRMATACASGCALAHSPARRLSRAEARARPRRRRRAAKQLPGRQPRSFEFNQEHERCSVMMKMPPRLTETQGPKEGRLFRHDESASGSNIMKGRGLRRRVMQLWRARPPPRRSAQPPRRPRRSADS